MSSARERTWIGGNTPSAAGSPSLVALKRDSKDLGV